MPNLIEWKAMSAGDYVLGLHVANSLFGRVAERERGALQTIAPMSSRHYGVEIGVLDGAEEARAFSDALATYTL